MLIVFGYLKKWFNFVRNLKLAIIDLNYIKKIICGFQVIIFKQIPCSEGVDFVYSTRLMSC